MPFPFQPDMIVAALGIGEYDPNKEYTLKEDAKTYSLVEQAVSAQGQQVQKVTVFNKVNVGPGKPQVVAYLLLDAKTGAEICRASVLEVQTVQIDRDRKAVLPQKVQAGVEAAANRNDYAAVRHAGEQHRRGARRQAVQPRRPGLYPLGQSRPGVCYAERVFAGDGHPTRRVERAGEVTTLSNESGAQRTSREHNRPEIANLRSLALPAGSFTPGSPFTPASCSSDRGDAPEAPT